MKTPNPDGREITRPNAKQLPADSRWPMLWAVTAAFGTYFCMYAFRKPFAVAEYSDLTAWGWQYKTIAVSTQVVGYMLSKFIGIKILSEMPAHLRAISVVGLIGLAELALILFAIIPAPYNLICLFLNGLPLGMIFGLVLGFLEGRRQTEALAAGLCTSFILSDGVSKSVGKMLLDAGVAEFWMPAGVGAIFLLPLLGFVWMLKSIRPPTQQDRDARSERVALNSNDRHAFVSKHALGLIPILVMFLLVTILRSIRSDFAPEIWTSLGVDTKPGIFIYSEMWVGLAVVVINGAAVLISDNYKAFRSAIMTCILGFVILLLATSAQQAQSITPFAFMVFIGVGLYLPYIATHTTVFERLIAMTRDKSNLVFLMYLADAIGYLGYVAVMVARNVLQTHEDADFMAFFRPMCYCVGVIALMCMLVSQVYFARTRRAAIETVTS